MIHFISSLLCGGWVTVRRMHCEGHERVTVRLKKLATREKIEGILKDNKIFGAKRSKYR